MHELPHLANQDPKEFCEYIVPLSDGRHELTDGGVYERILDGEQALGELK